LFTIYGKISLDMMTIVEVNAEKLRQLRGDRTLSLRELAKLSGVAHTTLWYIEDGRRTRTHPSTIRKLATALGVEPQELIR
jgi:transcriptional regulator with XRE-family HTH domain